MPQYFNFALNKTSIYYDDGVNYNIAAAPLYFVRSGYIHPGGGKSWAVGLTGHCWSLRGDIISTSYGLGFNAAGVIPSNGPHERLYAFPLRCLSTVLGM